MKKTVGLLLALCLLLALLTGGPAMAAGGPEVLDTAVKLDFPMSLDFSLAAAGDRPINDVRLHYTVDRTEFADIVQEIYVPVEADNRVRADYHWDMRKTGGMPPGSRLTYWWTLTDDGGNRAETAPATVDFNDDDHEWRSLNWERVTVYWYRGDAVFGEEIMATTRAVLERLTADTGVVLARPVKLYIYGSASDLKGSMIFPQEWTGGVAFTRYGIMAIGIGPDNLAWGRRAIAHELTHLVIHQATVNPYGGLPTWLDEGLAMNSEGKLEDWFQGALGAAYYNGSLISVQSLCSPFSAYADESTLGYAQSYSLVDYLIATYGQAKMFDLLSTFQRGSGYDAALESVYGFDMDGLDARWRQHLAATIGN